MVMLLFLIYVCIFLMFFGVGVLACDV